MPRRFGPQRSYCSLLSIVLFIIMLSTYCARATNDQQTAAALETSSTSLPQNSQPFMFGFTQSVYNVSIPENSLGRTYATQNSGEDRLGIQITPDVAELEIKYKIMAGDRDKFFKAEERLVGDFCFLSIRTRTGTMDVLNRERRDKYVLEIRATATKRDSKPKVVLEAETIVIVKVLDTNDLNPFFVPSEYEQTVPEDTPLHKSILKVQAEDADLGRNGEIYYSFLEDTEQFAIHPMSGVITLTRPLQYTVRSYHELTVLAQDRSSLFVRSSAYRQAKVRIRVKQVNLYSPEIYVQHLPHIVEHSNADIYAIVRVIDKDRGIHGEIKSLDIVDGDPDGHFRIRPASAQKGEYNIEVLRLLDREQTPQGYNLTLRAADNGIPSRQSYKSVPVHLADLNDNAPVFNREIYEVKVPETAPINTPVIRLKVTDSDDGKNAQVFLEIVGGNEGGEFRINPDTGMLYTAMKLDYESKAFYTLTVSAIDQGNTGTRKQSSAKVKINVEDRNDNDPIFDKPEQTVWIDENEPPGTSVTKVTAKDRDSGENGYISYSIANLKPVPFEIDHFSGVVRTKSIIDYESMRREYILRVRASDWGLPYRRQTEMQLTIKVKDINDNRPQFEKVDCVGHIPRYISIGTELMTLSAIDFDRGNIISYRIVSGNEDHCFNLDSTSGVLSVSCDLNDVKVSERELNVTATDNTHFADISRIYMHLVQVKRNIGAGSRYSGGDPNTGFECRDTGVARRLTEVLAAAEKNNMAGYAISMAEEFGMMPSRYGQNMHIPEFIDFPLEIRVNESVPLGIKLAKLKARDRDLGYNGKLVFGISGGDEDSVFCLDADTGELRVIGYLDRERESEYFLNITVYDLGKPQKASSRILPVTILDVNDNAPKFEKTLASFRVTENALNGTAVFRANATDVDIGDNAKITYSLVTDTEDFCVNSGTGVLSVCSNLDRERQELYELRIRATDNGGGKNTDDIPALYSDAIVRISIDDINDNAPVFSLNSYNVKIREDIPKGSVVAIVTASDPDIGPGGDIVYSLIDNNDNDGAFKIDKLSGTIRTVKPLDFEERQVHILKVCAEDRGVPSLSSEAYVTVNVVDVNENLYAPKFEDFVLEGAVYENRPVGTEVMRVKATDQDPPGDDSRVSYSIRGGDGIGLFSIDTKGVIRTMAVLDIESKPHYWLTVYAQDHGVVPLDSSVEVFVKVLNENDNVPLTLEPIYYTSIPEDSPGGKVVVQMQAEDADNDPDEKLSYKIVSGNPEGFFSINSSTGIITTTARKLDRELQSEHILEVMVSDNGKPTSLSSTTRVVITVDDINDHGPKFEQGFYKIQIPASAVLEQALFQGNVSNKMESNNMDNKDTETDTSDSFFENENWQIFSAADASSNGGERVLRVLAFDDDIGKNGEISYSIKSGRGKAKFKIHPTTGVVYAQKPFEAGQEYDLMVKATDGGDPSKSQTCRVSIQVVAVPTNSEHPPVLKGDQYVDVTENDEAGFLVTLIQASDPDNDTLWFDIVDGDEDEEFYIGRDNGNVLLAHKLDREKKEKYNLTISVTDTIHTVFTQLYVTVIDINDHRPEFSESLYRIQISEVVPEGTEILKLQATDADAHSKLLFSLHSARHSTSMQDFKLDSLTGSLTLVKCLDRETIAEHLLTVMVRDGGTPAKRNYARVLITVHDHNDHTPQFSTPILEGKVYESAAIGSAVLRAYAIDQDYGDNAKISYSITSGNIGNVFSIDPSLGTIQVARELDLSTSSEYTLHIKATDHGRPPLSVSIPAHIMLTMADNAPPRFLKPELAAEIYENQVIGSYVVHLEARSTSSLLYEITEGNINDAFTISPSTGVIVLNDKLDYETTRFYNLTVIATNMAGSSAHCYVIIHVLDQNDNAPIFIQSNYVGYISEAAQFGALVLTNDSSPLVIKAFDADAELNSLLNYDIIEVLPRKYFHIDSNTGAIRTVHLLDHETNDRFEFSVKVTDLGKPRLSSETTANVKIIVTDVNDCTPVFTEKEYNVTLLLPTYKDVAVTQVNATDPDSPELTTLRYDIIDGNKEKIFHIDQLTGIIQVSNPDQIQQRYKLHVRVSDGKFSSIAYVNIKIENSENSGLVFQKNVYEGSVLENSTKISTVCVVNVVGSELNEHIQFSILNPTDLFTIGSTSGAIRTTGIRFDREVQDNYELIVEAKSVATPDRDKPRIAHVIVNVTVMDINDNCPMFVNLPYYAVVSIDDQKGDIITKVHAIDMDSSENGEVRYELVKGHGELFKVNRKTGEIELKQSLEGHNHEYKLTIAAYDGGITPCSTEVTVHVKVIDRSMPVFKKQFYSESIPENLELHSTLAMSVEAESPLGRKLIYSIVKGNELEEFALDFNTAPDSNNGPCVISIVDELDYEQKQQYELIVRATDSVSGVYAEVPVSVLIQDVNDCPPEFPVDIYNVSISEAASVGSTILKVSTRDNDTGINAKVQYSLQTDSNNSSEYFYIEPTEGLILLKQPLDHEYSSAYHFTVVATDMGIPSLSSTAHVWLKVLDMNDNPPKFDSTSYKAGLSIHASRGQFVTILSASDPDIVDEDNLKYTIVAGNEHQTFSMNPNTGIITLLNLANFGEERSTLLNISVSDGVYTSFTKLNVKLLPANLHSPVFPHVLLEAKIEENQPRGQHVITVQATDADFGEFGTLTYSIHSELLSEYFRINKDSGEIFTKVKLDREHQEIYEIPIMATDGGSRSGFMTVRVRVLDVNDNSPQFLLREYKASIHSNNSIGTPFLKIRAIDADENESAQIQYSIYETQKTGIHEIFAINPNTGGIFLIKSASAWESQTFQFFVRAKDNGSPSLHSDVPINVLIMAPSDTPPVFERNDDKFFLSENSPIGTVITRLKMVSNVSVIYRIISGSEENSEFTIDSQGQLALARPLDFDLKDSYLIGIVAETDSSPPLTALAEVALQVLDENDHVPKFESSPYTILIAENIEEGTSILKVMAHDEDKGNNGEVRYSIGIDSEDTVNVFAIDAYTGWINTLIKLDKEEKSEYRFYVIASDNGTPKLKTRTTVVVRLKDYNDSPPVFKNSIYEASVREDAAPGTAFIQLGITDADLDLNTPVKYYIIGGDSRSQFQIRDSGEVYVAKPLDRESISSYKLEIIATDGLFSARTKLQIEGLDANDNPPYCVRYRYRQVLSEGILPGSYILTILATDVDDHAQTKLKYYLTGIGADKFSLDIDNGYLKTARSLDRENQTKYLLIAHVQDREHTNWECSSQVELIVSDLNDNPPIFSSTHYSVAIPEDVDVGTLVTKVHATDADIGINRKIKYSFIDSARDHFKIAADSGIVTLAKPLDRELRAMFNLTIQAVDQGTPQLSSSTILVVNVQDINDNPPEFTSKYYFANVAENTMVGSEITSVMATSKDTGVNAEVYYSIVGGNEHKKFTIDVNSGVIKLIEPLDYERAKDYFLTIQAVDGGNPPLSNLATMNITVIDSNDNEPVFSQQSYSTIIREDAQVGDKVLQVVATDLDSGENGRITYKIKRGDRLGQFVIDEETGYISVGGNLDRESISVYVLEIYAEDNGLPQLSSSVDINIEISDANDNKPIFSQQNYSAVIQEDKPIGFSILKFIVTDADTYPNAAPYTFDFHKGNENGLFRIEQDGILRTATKFNHRIKDNYLLQIRVFDNGTPPLYSDTWVVVKIIEESQYPPVITPLEISINSYQDDYPGGIIGKVYTTDQDQYDTLTYSITQTNGIKYPMTDLFQIDRTDGTLKAFSQVDVGEYRLNISVTDGKFYAFALVKVFIDSVTDEMLENSVVIRFREVSPHEFILSHKKGFIRTVRNALKSRLKDVILISVQPSSDSSLLHQRSVRGELQHPAVLSDDFSENNVHQRSVRNTFTNYSNYQHSKQFGNHDLDVLFAVKKAVVGYGGYFSSETIRKALNKNLIELEESTKLVVEEIVPMKCTNTFCVFGECRDRIILDNTKLSTISTDVISFVSPYHEHKLECSCKQGYGGDRCDNVINDCAREPCSKFKLCVPDSSTQGYTCQCPEGFAGINCDVDVSKCHDETCYIPRNPVSFSGKSYAQYDVKGVEDKLSFSLRIRTLQLTGTLMYAAGIIDYNILEVVNGAVQYRFELGNGEGLVKVSTLFVSDGHWHEIKLERDGNSARITVDATHVAHGSAPGVSDMLNIQDNDIYIGAEVKQHPTVLGFEDIQRGFSGCMDDIRVSRVPIPLHKSGANSVAILKRFANVEFSCDTLSVLRPPGACSSQPCQNGGTCKEVKNGYECQCHSRFLGAHCEIDTDPCASSPCLFGGKCSVSTHGNDFVCECIPARLKGKRCEYGHYCEPNPCRHGGFCEEGDTGPLCKCKFWTGNHCELDLDECETNPCQNGGTCLNEPGSYKCFCPPNTTGVHCSNPIYSTPITSNIYNITLEELYLTAAVVGAIIFLVLIFIIYRRCHMKRNIQRANMINNIQEPRDKTILNSTRPHELVEFKRGSKLSNLEISQRDQPLCPPRPTSYTPSSNNEPLYSYNASVVLNNLDTLRSYGSAGDELENVPPDYLRNLNRNTLANGGINSNNCGSDADSLHKTTWAEQMHLASFADGSKIKNDLKHTNPSIVEPPTNRFILPSKRLLQNSNSHHHNNSSGGGGDSEDSRLGAGMYHWDCSDWVRRSQNPLPDITEVPGSEVPDSSSFHSNESNESKCHHISAQGSGREIEPLNEEMESESLTEYGSTTLNALDNGTEDYRFNSDSYLRHPNSYLPIHGYNIPSETEGGIDENTPLHSPTALSDHDVEPYGFPSNRNRRKYQDDDIGSVITTLDERHSLLTSNSDLSTNLCEIEESECETEIKPLNWITNVHQTSV